MKRAALIVPICLLSLLIGIRLSGQQEAKVEKPKNVKQGSTLPLEINTDKASNVSASYLNVQIGPVGGDAVTGGNCGNFQGTKAACGLAIPFDAKLGTWKIMKVTFNAGTGLSKDLTPTGDLTFEVTPHENLVLPSQAAIEIK